MRVKMSKQPPPAPTTSAVGPCPTVIQIVGRPGTGSLPSTIAPPDHPLFIANTRSMFALLYQFWFYILSPENEWSKIMVAAILGKTGSSKFIARLVTIHVLLSNFMMQNNCFMITLRLIISRYNNSHFVGDLRKKI